MRTSFGISAIIGLLAGTIPPATTASAKEKYAYGEKATVALELVGCRELKRMNRIAELLIEGDPEAGVKVAIEGGEKCRAFAAGERVNVEGFSKPHALVCIRPKGDQNCYWYPSNYMK